MYKIGNANGGDATPKRSKKRRGKLRPRVLRDREPSNEEVLIRRKVEFIDSKVAARIRSRCIVAVGHTSLEWAFNDTAFAIPMLSVHRFEELRRSNGMTQSQSLENLRKYIEDVHANPMETTAGRLLLPDHPKTYMIAIGTPEKEHYEMIRQRDEIFDVLGPHPVIDNCAPAYMLYCPRLNDEEYAGRLFEPSEIIGQKIRILSPEIVNVN